MTTLTRVVTATRGDDLRPRVQRPNRWLGIGLIVLGAGVAASSILGPFVADVIRYHTSAEMVNQVIGGDVVALFLVAPVSIFAGILALRGHPAAPAVSIGPAIFAAYTYTQLALGGDFLGYPGNSERVFLLDLWLFMLGTAIAATSWAMLDTRRLPPTSRRFDRALSIFLLAVAAFLVLGLHLPGLLDTWHNEPTAPEYLYTPTPFWLVKFMDLGIVAPALIVIAIGTLRNARWAEKGKYSAIGWVALLGSSVAAMAIVMQAEDDPSASAGNTIVFGSFAAIALAMALRVYWPLFRTGGAVAVATGEGREAE
jgi:hypothetical protein